ncbi:hypothetical protein N7471_002764 [Penicillium samsonianum]|uniref:uncharacterized protein n=1 Tax=Penicillium samsonianum TaxID=1882272 RepID=UPI002546FC57|nr:uncharacterized protein N7471_002764 [Penicillium samsonianum]KAJ6143311.1 hypothetical protein N7471_002764 [Penicillium samsonianum]
MAQALRASRQSADDVAAGFYAFRDPLPEHVGEITSLMSELYAISSSLTTLERLADDPRNRRYFDMIKPDLNVVQASFTYTIEDIGDILRGLDGADGSPARYKRTWVIMSRFFWDQSNYTLATRLAKYKTVFKEFNDLVRDGHYTSSLLVGLVNGFKSLLSIQDGRFAARFEGMTLRPNDSPTGHRASPPSPVRERPPRERPLRDRPVSDRNARRRRSYERTRPPHMSPPPMSPSSATSSDFPPSVPDIPLSPLTSTSATTATSNSSSPDVIKEHWAKDTFGSSGTSTPLPSVRERSHCRGEPQQGIKQSIKDKGFEELLQLSLNDESDMRVSFYLRRTDHRVRILCREPHRSGPSDYYCLPLNLLEILRDGSCLRLCRRRNRGTELVLWTQLKFTTLEDLVLFHNTFLALRSQDAGHPIGEILDHELAHEQQHFGGTITDDDYMHALRVYKDRVTGAVRLQASVHLGDMNHTPVWTAFVTHNLGKRSWLKSYDSKTVILRDIKPVVFMSMDDYNPPQTSQGHHVLEFTSSSDAREFLDVMDELGG